MTNRGDIFKAKNQVLQNCNFLQLLKLTEEKLHNRGNFATFSAKSILKVAREKIL